MSSEIEVSFVIHKDPQLDHTGTYANEVTQGGPLESFKTGAGRTRKSRHKSKRLELLASSPDHREGAGRVAGV